MKVASYNIMSGGFADYESEAYVPERLSAIKQVLEEIDADVVGLIDTFRWDKLYSVAQLQDMFGYAQVMCVNLNDDRLGSTSNGLTLLSRRPWLRCGTVRIATRDALRVVFSIDQREISIVLAYLDDLKEDVRLRQIKALFSATTTDVLTGDLNTVAPVDVPQAVSDLKEFYIANPHLQTALEPITKDMLRGEVIAYLQTKGFVDAGVSAGCTLPTELFPANTTKPFLRLDYCLYTDSVRVSDFAVHVSEMAGRASDHFPVVFRVG